MMDKLVIICQVDDLVHWVYKGLDGTSRILGGLAQDTTLDEPDFEIKFKVRQRIKQAINDYLGYEEPEEDPCYGCMSQCHINCPIGRSFRWRKPCSSD